MDHATRTLDGYGAVHVMGQMATFTPAVNSTRKVPRVKVNMDDVKKIGHVKLVSQKDPKPILDGIIYTKLGIFNRDEENSKLDLMWTVSFHLPKPRPMWSGYMQMLHSHIPHPGKSSDIFLPMVDLTPSDPTCVRSTLEYVVDHAKRQVTTPVITFDQQLWWIAYMVIESQPVDSPLHQIVLILGGFHTKMSYIGTIGSLMAGSGLKEAISQVYAEGSVDQMLVGKAVARAFRAHLLVDCALNTIATSHMFSVPVPKVFEDPNSSAADVLSGNYNTLLPFHYHMHFPLLKHINMYKYVFVAIWVAVHDECPDITEPNEPDNIVQQLEEIVVDVLDETDNDVYAGEYCTLILVQAVQMVL